MMSVTNDIRWGDYRFIQSGFQVCLTAHMQSDPHRPPNIPPHTLDPGLPRPPRVAGRGMPAAGVAAEFRCQSVKVSRSDSRHSGPWELHYTGGGDRSDGREESRRKWTDDNGARSRSRSRVTPDGDTAWCRTREPTVSVRRLVRLVVDPETAAEPGKWTGLAS